MLASVVAVTYFIVNPTTAPRLFRPIETNKLAASFHCKPAYDPPSVVTPVESLGSVGQDTAAAIEATAAALGAEEIIPRAPTAATSKLLIRAGRVIEHADSAAPLQPQHRLQILMAVKVSDIAQPTTF